MKYIKIGDAVINSEDISFILEDTEKIYKSSSSIYLHRTKDPIHVNRFPIEIKFLLENGSELPMTDERKNLENKYESISKKYQDFNQNYFTMRLPTRTDRRDYLIEMLDAKNSLKDYLEKEYIEYSRKGKSNEQD